jgi:hypothetical protein
MRAMNVSAIRPRSTAAREGYRSLRTALSDTPTAANRGSHPRVKLARFAPPRLYALEGAWYFVLEPENGSTRLIARAIREGYFRLPMLLLLEIPQFLMERGMMLGMKDRAERDNLRSSAATAR